MDVCPETLTYHRGFPGVISTEKKKNTTKSDWKKSKAKSPKELEILPVVFQVVKATACLVSVCVLTGVCSPWGVWGANFRPQECLAKLPFLENLRSGL